jgi:hypothetical protein
MKLSISLVLVLLCSIVCLGQSSINAKKLTATRGAYKHYYSSENKHVIHYVRNGNIFRVKGFVTSYGTDSITVHNRQPLPFRIAVTEIQKIKTPNRGFRLVAGGVMFAGLACMIPNLPIGGSESEASSYTFMAGAVAILVGAMVFPISYVNDKANESRTKGGWMFAIE